MRGLRLVIVFVLASLWAIRTWAGTDGGLVGHWQFAGSDGKTVKDRSPRGNDGVIEAGELRKEQAGTSAEFDGLDGHIVIVEKTPFGLTNAITTAIWVKAHEFRNNTAVFGIPNAKPEWTTPVFGMYANDRRIVYGLGLNKGSNKTLVESPGDMPLDVWTFLVGTYDGKTAKLYVNGAQVAELAATGDITGNGNPLLIGKGHGAKPSLKGRVGELRLYSRAMGSDEVRALYDQTKGAYDLSSPVVKGAKDGTVIVETHGMSPEGSKPWRPQPTRLLELVDGYKPSGNSVKVNQYGGWLDRPAEKATGFFYVKKIDGRQWLIDPEGRRYFNVAINAVSPPKGVRSQEEWAEQTTETLRSIGFNGLGNFGANVGMRNVKRPLPWVLRKNFMFTFAKEKKLTEPASGTVGFANKCMPVFHPDFEPFCEQFGKDLADTATDPFLLGIMTDNELQCPVDLLDRYLALDVNNPDLKSGHDAAAAWLAARKGPGGEKKITQRDRYEFIAFAFERYYRIVTKVIRKHDRNHLYLGSRINYHVGEFDNPYFWKQAIAPYHDVVSVNYYAVWGPEPRQVESWEKWADRPILITEWYAKAMDVPGLANTKGAGWLVHTQEDRAKYYQHYALRSLELRNIVGWHWFKFRDDPAESVALDNAGGANKGMFTTSGEPHKPLVERARAVNREIYPLIEFFDARGR